MSLTSHSGRPERPLWRHLNSLSPKTLPKSRTVRSLWSAVHPARRPYPFPPFLSPSLTSGAMEHVRGHPAITKLICDPGFPVVNLVRCQPNDAPPATQSTRSPSSRRCTPDTSPPPHHAHHGGLPLEPYKSAPPSPSRRSTLTLPPGTPPCSFNCGTAELCSDSAEDVAVGSSTVASSWPSRSSIKPAEVFPLIPSTS